MTRLLRGFATPCLMALVATISVTAFADETTRQMELVGKPAPKISGTDLAGKPVSLSSLRGRVVLLDFWAMWCGPCVRAIPHVQKIADLLADKPVTVLGVNLDPEGSDQKLKKFLEQRKITIRQFLDPDSNVSKKYRVSGIPCTVLIGTNGIIQAIEVGFSSEETLAGEIDKLLKGETLFDERQAKQSDENVESSTGNSDLLLIRVVDPAGHPIPVRQVIEPHVYINGPDRGWWTNKMPIERRLPDESILVPRKSLVLAKPGQKFELEFLPPQGLPMTASGTFPKHDSDPIVLATESGPEMPDIDETAGPSDVRTNEVAGRVVDPKGNPVAGAAVSLECGYPKSEPVMTDANGAFRFANQGERMWGMYLQVQKDGFGTRQITDVPIGRGFTIKLDDTTRLKGQFTLPDGKPAGKTTVTLTRNKKTMRAMMGYLVHGLRLDRQTEDNGVYDFPLEPGVYEAQVVSEHGHFARLKNIHVDAGKTTDLASQLQPGVRLRLQTVDSVTGKPVSGVKLIIWDLFPGLIKPKAGSERVTDKRGFAEWSGLMPGPTSFEVIKKEYKRFWSTNDIEYERRGWEEEEFKGPPSMGRAIGPLNLDLRQEMPTLIVQIERGGHVHGKVVGPNSQPAGKMLVNLNVKGIGVFSGDARYQFVTDDEGRFSSYLPAGNGTLYNLSAHDPQGRWANAVSKTFGSKPGDELEFTLQMSDGGWISGRVVDRDGKPVPHVEVYSVATDQLDNPYFDPTAITDDQGHFKLGPMRAGDYAIGQRLPKTITHAGLNKSSEKHFSLSKGRTADAGDLLHTGDSQE